MKFNAKEVEKIKSCLKIDDYKTLKRMLNSKIRLYNKKERKTKTSVVNSIKATALTYKTDLIDNATTYEKLFEELLKVNNIVYEFQYIYYYNKNNGLSFYILDFYLPDKKLVVEIDGKQHYTKELIDKDFIRDSVLKEDPNIDEVIRFTNEDIYSRSEECINQILEYNPNKEITEDHLEIGGTKYKRRKN